MSAYDLLVDGFPHGTPKGYLLGCRSNGGCPGKEFGLTCSRANMRYQGDFVYRRRVDEGLSAAEIVALEVEEAAAAKAAARVVRAVAAKPVVKKPRKVKTTPVRRPEPSRVESAQIPVVVPAAAVVAGKESKRQGVLEARRLLRAASRELAAAQVALQGAVRAFVEAEHALEVAEAVVVPPKPRVQAPKVKREPKQRKVLPHGTNAAYLRCRAAGVACRPCVDAHRQYHRNYVAGRRLAGVPAEAHGTAYGYQLGCKDRESCPSDPSCADASLAEERRRRREQGIPAAEFVDAEPVLQRVRELMAAGESLLSVAERADVSKSVLKSMLYGRSGLRRGERSERLSVENAGRILALEAVRS